MAQTRPIHEIAEEVYADWGTKLSPYAKDYLDAMTTLDRITDTFYCDSGKSVVSYFLANASGWRGETARRIKKELNALL